jgi:hypothetical protein
VEAAAPGAAAVPLAEEAVEDVAGAAVRPRAAMAAAASAAVGTMIVEPRMTLLFSDSPL